MRSRPPYTPVKFYYDVPILGSRDPSCRLKEGCYIVSNAGSGYWVQRLHRSKRIRGRNNLLCLRWPVGEIPEGACVHSLTWYPRKRKLSRSPKLLDHMGGKT